MVEPGYIEEKEGQGRGVIILRVLLHCQKNNDLSRFSVMSKRSSAVERVGGRRMDVLRRC